MYGVANEAGERRRRIDAPRATPQAYGKSWVRAESKCSNGAAVR
jgi:hypothetical protein